MDRAARELALEAARLLCEEGGTDYRAAKLKAAQRLGLGSRAALPDNASIQAAVIDYQRLYGGAAYQARLRRLRSAAVQAMRLLLEFDPRFTGAAVSGAITDGHRVQLHGFADMPESLDLLLEDRGIPFTQDERSYRYADGRSRQIPLSRFEAGEVGIDVAMFDLDDLRQPPLSPSDGLPMRRLTLAQAERLLDADARELQGSGD